MRDQRGVACRQGYNLLGPDAFCHKALQIGVDNPVVLRYQVIKLQNPMLMDLPGILGDHDIYIYGKYIYEKIYLEYSEIGLNPSLLYLLKASANSSSFMGLRDIIIHARLQCTYPDRLAEHRQ